MSGQFYATATLPRGKTPTVPIEKEAGWAPEPVWTTWRRENSWSYQDSKSDISVVQPVASRYTDYAIPATIETVKYLKILLKYPRGEAEKNHEKSL
jgi:hypothetical protein